MPRPSLKKLTEAAATEMLGGFWVDDVLPNVGAEATSPKRSADGQYSFDLTYHRERGHPKMYRVTIEEIA